MVADISDGLLEHLNTEEALGLMLAANLPGISRAQVQDSFLPFATELGFASEARGPSRDYFRRVESSATLSSRSEVPPPTTR